MSTRVLDSPRELTRRQERTLRCLSTLVTYAVGLWIVAGNPFMHGYIEQPALHWAGRSNATNTLLQLFTLVFGTTPIHCLLRIAGVAAVIQSVHSLTVDDDRIDLDRHRPFVFWRAIFRFLNECSPFLRRLDLSRPPSTSLTEYERITVRYVFVRLLFLPLMVSFFYSSLQNLINVTSAAAGPPRFTAASAQHFYVIWYLILMVVDLAWFGLGCAIETQRFSAIRMVDPYASGWIVTLCCYPPFSSLTSQVFPWSVPEFPGVTNATAVYVYAGIGAALFTFYVIADISFGIKAGNLTYRGLVDKGPYRWVRHPMYASKNLAWFIFTLPAMNFHVAKTHILYLTAPVVSANWSVVAATVAWMLIYACRALTEERYLLLFPEYREYCKRVRRRFIPGVL